MGYRERLATLQGAWDSLALLSHLSEDGTNLSNTREAFESLATDLVTHLETETHRKALLAARARAQVAIDILVRNLFERTADVGFLAADDAIADYASRALALRSLDDSSSADPEGGPSALTSASRTIQRRLAEYVSKYSVYQNVILLSPAGEVLLQLDGGTAPAVSRDPLIAATLATDGYVESFHCSDLVPGGRRALIYSHRVASERQTLGVLCLCFRLEDECESIFAQLRSEADWAVLSLLDAGGEVIFSSDAWQLPVGAKLAADDSGNILRFAGREFLAVTCKAQPYQGYTGPPWRGHVMVPLERAFEAQTGGEQPGCVPEVLAQLRATASKFSTGLREIPRKADAVQLDLNRSVWNGSVRLSLGNGSNGTFAKALLREISNMGRKTKEVFERSIEELHETVVTAVMHDSRFLASLASELLARNFYERANDCRWWALNATLGGRLAGAPDCTDEATTLVLRHINSLYTVYHAIVLFDSQRRIVATSRPEQEEMLGPVIEDSWASETLALSGTQAYSVSQFRPSPLYGGRPTLIFAAAVRSAEGRCVGGIAVVFDTAPQLAAMLQDAIPKDERGQAQAGCVALFLDRELNVLSCTDPAMDMAGLDLAWLRQSARTGEARILRSGNEYHSAGARRDTGYREFEGLGGYALVLIPLGTVAPQSASRSAPTHRPATRQEGTRQDSVEFATFAVGENWYALPTANVIEAVDARSLQSLPKTEPWCAGYLMFAGEPIVVADTARLLGTTHLDTPRMVIAIRAPGRKRPIGLLVESLGDILEVARNRLLSIGGLRNRSASALVEQAIEVVDPRDPMVMILDAACLAALICGEPLLQQVEAAA